MEWTVQPERPGLSRHRCPGQRNAHYHDRKNFVSLHLPDSPPIIDPSLGIDSRASIATSIFAAALANLNSAGMSPGKRPFCFLSLWLYNDGYEALMDIVDGGGSTACSGGIPYASWNVTTGWDPVIGLGTLNFQKDSAVRTQ